MQSELSLPQVVFTSQLKSEALVEALLNAPLPNKALLAAAVRYQQTIGGHPTKLTDVTQPNRTPRTISHYFARNFLVREKVYFQKSPKTDSYDG